LSGVERERKGKGGKGREGEGKRERTGVEGPPHCFLDKSNPDFNSAPPNLLAEFKGPTSKKEGMGRDGQWESGSGRGEGEDGMRGEGREGDA